MSAILKLGSKETAAVRQLQDLLRDQGYWSDASSGRFGTALEDAVVYFQQTHLGPGGKPLTVDGWVGDDTWWALRNATGDAQRSFIEGKIPDGISELRQTVLETVLAEHGAKEIPNGSNRGPQVDKYLPKWCLSQKGHGPAWCCFFVSWGTKEALGTYPLKKRLGSCSQASKQAKNLSMWHPNDGSYLPRPGDAFVMLYTGKKVGKGHIGFVLRVDPVTGRFNTVEGNCGNRVKVGLRDYDDDPHIAGFINFYGDESDSVADLEYGVIDAQNVAADGTR